MSIAERLRKLLADLEASLQPETGNDYASVRRSYEADGEPDAVAMGDRGEHLRGDGADTDAPAAQTPAAGAAGRPVAATGSAAARRDWVRAQLANPESARRAFLLREVLQRPYARRRVRPGRL